MARVALSQEPIVIAGLEPTQTALIADGHSFPNDGIRTHIRINNGATAFTLTVITPMTVEGLAVADKTYSIGANEIHEIGPFDPKLYNNADGLVFIDYSDVTDGTVEIKRVPA